MKPNLSNLIKVSFYFPQASLVKNKQELVNLIIKAMSDDGNIKYAGYSSEIILKKDLLYRIGHFDCNHYRTPSKRERQSIIKTIRTTVVKCNKILPLPTKIFIFIFPWFPSEKESAFNGSVGFAVYKCVLHLFIAPDIVSEKSIANSVAHEINHIVSYYYHPDRYARWSLLDHIINEGLAENFREDVLKTKSMPWAIALSKKKAFKILKEIYPKLNSKDKKIHRSVLFGNENYKRWTGYSIGYWLVKEFKNRNRKLSWEEIIKIKPEDILKSIKIGRSNF